MADEASKQTDFLSRIAPSDSGVVESRYDARYSKFVRLMRYVLMLVALAIIALVFLWGNMKDERIVPVQNDLDERPSIGKNELLNPKFESRDQRGQPFTVTAKRALQGAEDENLLILEAPVGEISLNSGSKITVKADQGAYRQDNQRLFLRGAVHIFHDFGYEMDTQELSVDMEGNVVWSDTPVFIQGAAGTLEALSVRAQMDDEILTFTGPAKIIFNRSGNNANLGSLFGE